MKTLKCAFFLLTFTGLLFIGCSDTQKSPVTPDNGSNSSVNSLKKTTGPGAWIFRNSNTPYDAFVFLDEANGYLLTLGIKDPSEFCSGTNNYDVFSFKELWLPNADPDQRRVILKIKGDNISAFVWHFDSAPANIILFMCSNQPTAGGTAKFISNDNDYFSFLQENNNMNSLGTKANGTLTGTGGEIYKLNLVYHAVWDGENILSLKEIIKVNLALTGKK